MTEQLWWYVARSTGIVAVVLAAMSVIWGLLLGSKVLEGRPGPRWLLDLHRWLGGLTLGFTGAHVAALMLDSYVDFGLVDILVPGASEWKPGAVAWGVVSAWLLLAVQLSSLIMKRLPRHLWKGIHMLSYLMLWTGIVHGVKAGTDAGNPIYVWSMGALSLAVAYLTVYRILTVRRRRRHLAAHASSPRSEAVGAFSEPSASPL